MALAAAAAVAGLGLGQPEPHTSNRRAGQEGEVSGRTRITALRAYPAALGLLLLIGVEFLSEGCLNLLSVAFANDQLGRGPAAAGLLIGALGAGAIIGAAISIVLALWRRLAVAVSAGLVLAGLPLWPCRSCTQSPWRSSRPARPERARHSSPLRGSPCFSGPSSRG